MQKDSPAYIYIFAIIVALVCSVALGAVSSKLKPQQEENALVDKYSKILLAIDEYNTTDKKLKPAEIKAYFNEGFNDRFVEVVIFDKDGVEQDITKLSKKEKENLDIVNLEKLNFDEVKYFPIYVFYKNKESKENKKVDYFVIPIAGKGLWSVCYGFLALKDDATTIKNLIYYDHKETPGLGAKIVTDTNWVGQFPDKTILNDKGEVLFEMDKTGTKVKNNEGNYFSSISGATLTLDGVDAMMKRFLPVYNKYLITKRKK